MSSYADESSNPSDLGYQSNLAVDFNIPTFGGFERRRITNQVRVRGWRVGKYTYIGQARVDNHWGPGFIVTRGNTVYGMNHRGIQVMRKF